LPHATLDLGVIKLTSSLQMADLKENIEAEVANARENYQKMESHIRLYINEMDQAISSGQFPGM
jgi:hypothetical protein